jgi:hypothetical protein
MRHLNPLEGTEGGLIALISRGRALKLRKEGNTMTYHIFFWALCVAFAVQPVVAAISIAKAYRNEQRSLWPQA